MCTETALIVMEKLCRFLLDCPAGGVDERCDALSGISHGLLWSGDDVEALVLERVGPDDEACNCSSGGGRRLMSVAFSDPAHYCKDIPCDFCGKDWPWVVPTS